MVPRGPRGLCVLEGPSSLEETNRLRQYLVVRHETTVGANIVSGLGVQGRAGPAN